MTNKYLSNIFMMKTPHGGYAHDPTMVNHFNTSFKNKCVPLRKLFVDISG